jgi:hypothetical protein
MRRMPAYQNTFWIGGNLLFDLATGGMSQVLMLVYNEEDATTFTKQIADGYLYHIKTVAARVGKIEWTVETSIARKEFFVIKGVQDV